MPFLEMSKHIHSPAFIHRSVHYSCVCVIFAAKTKVWCSLLNGSRQKLLQKRFWHFWVCEFPSYKCGLAQIENGNETEEEFEEDEDAQEPLEPEINGTPSDLSHVTEMRLVPKDSSVCILYLLMYTFCPSVRVKSSLVILLMLWKYFILIAEVWERGGTVEFQNTECLSFIVTPQFF
jgi:hypothetical protein